MKTTLRNRKLEELNWMEFKRLVPKKTDAVLLPVGTIEAHGVTGLGTDNQIPLSICGRIADKVNALIAPAVNYGITKTLLPYPGSLTVLPETFEGYVAEVAGSLADAGFRRIVFLNGHGGNTEALKNVTVRLYRDKRTYSMVIDWWTLCSEEVGKVYGHAGGHAGTDETALVQVDHPEQVRVQEYKKEMVSLAQPGLAAIPFPGSIILYKQDEGYPDFDPAKAEQLMTAICAKVEKTILDVFRRWQTIR
ncbi:MAG: creatininase family protein [candidate division WOR-3 bacterium]|nr:creatininase family protein [candidate division WOR-3 bacterium]